jgi:hypothetical protein
MTAPSAQAVDQERLAALVRLMREIPATDFLAALDMNRLRPLIAEAYAQAIAFDDFLHGDGD